MKPPDSDYSPNILIYLEIDKKQIRLADVLEDTATLYEPVVAEVKADTGADLVFLINGFEERESIVLHEGISKDSSLISFSYVNRSLNNGPYNKRIELR